MPRRPAPSPSPEPGDERASSHRPSRRSPSGADLIARCTLLGGEIGPALQAIVAALPADRRGTVGLARHLAIDKVLSSRVLKALRSTDPIAVIHHLPGPEPLRRFTRAARALGLSTATIDAADRAIDRFETLIRDETGDRGTLDAILSDRVPEARAAFALRRKQAAYRAMSELKGLAARQHLAAVLLYPGSDPLRIDVVWIFGTLGLQRLRDGVPVKFASRRIGPESTPRSPATLRGEAVDAATGLAQLRLDAHCSRPAPELVVQRAGDVIHYTLADSGFGPHSAVDLVFAEVNRNEIDRYASPAAVTGRAKQTYFFAEVPIPSEHLLFDVFAHEDVFPGREPTLSVYDTALEGIASPNDPGRDIDRLDTAEAVVPLGRGLAAAATRLVPFHASLLAETFDALRWNPDRMRGWRTAIDYPVYGSQVTLAFEPPTRP
jgi:hypothetical protein